MFGSIGSVSGWLDSYMNHHVYIHVLIFLVFHVTAYITVDVDVFLFHQQTDLTSSWQQVTRPCSCFVLCGAAVNGDTSGSRCMWSSGPFCCGGALSLQGLLCLAHVVTTRGPHWLKPHCGGFRRTCEQIRWQLPPR